MLVLYNLAVPINGDKDRIGSWWDIVLTQKFFFFNVSLVVDCNSTSTMKTDAPIDGFNFVSMVSMVSKISQIEARALEKQHPVDTSPPPKQTCEKCKMKLEKEAGEMDVQNLGVYLQMVCEREGGDTALCVRIGKQYHANQLHDEQNLDMALGRFCTTFYDIPCKDDEEEKEDGGRVRRLRRRRLR